MCLSSREQPILRLHGSIIRLQDWRQILVSIPMHCSCITELTAVAPPFARRLNELNNEVVLLTSKMNILKDEISETKKDFEEKMEGMIKKMEQYEEERSRKRSIDTIDGAEERLERRVKKRTVVVEY